jgi:ferredoxin-type protein NapH
MIDQQATKIGPNGKPIRHFVMPRTLIGKLKVWRYLILRRVVQVSILVMFFGSANWAWSYHDKPLLNGNLSSSRLLDLIPLADPFAVLQLLSAGNSLLPDVLIGAVIILLFYLLVGGRVWCSWVCPVNIISDLASRARRSLDINNALQLSRKFRYTMLVLTLLLSALTGVAAFEWISPISIFHREIIFGLGSGWTILLGIFVFDVFILRDGWCGHLCPLGAFYSLVGRFSLLRIRFNTPTCTHCVECTKVCPEPQVLDLKRASERGFISAGECTNCGRCISVCPENTLKFDLLARYRVPIANLTEQVAEDTPNKTTETNHRRKIA